MFTIKTYLAQTPDKGIGIFANEDVKKGQIIWLADSNFFRTYNDSEVQKMEPYKKDFIIKYGYTTSTNPETWVLELDNARFTNHDDNPNTTYDIATNSDCAGTKGWATRDIKKGEEITCDYSSFNTHVAESLDFSI